MRANVFIGFPLGGLLSVAIAAAAAIVLRPLGVEVTTLGQVALPVVTALGTLGIVLVLVGFFAATFGAACETGLSVGYSVAQYFGWQWGKFVEPLRAARFHTVVLLSCIAGVGILLTTVDPIMVTEYSVVFSALALPLTYLPDPGRGQRPHLPRAPRQRAGRQHPRHGLPRRRGRRLAGRDPPHGRDGSRRMTRDTEPGRPIEAGTPLALGLRLLDHQILGRDQEMVGNVDDVALEERDGRLVAVGLLRGPGAWARRQPGALGRWGRAVWRRLDPREDPRPLVLPLDHVLSIGSAVHVDPWADAFLAGSDGLELWLRRHVVGAHPRRARR